MNQGFDNSFPPIDEPKKKSNTTLIIIIVVLVVLCICCLVGGVAWSLWTYGDQLFETFGSIGQLFNTVV